MVLKKSLFIIFLTFVIVSCESAKKIPVNDNDDTGKNDNNVVNDDSEEGDDNHVSETCGNEVVEEGEVCDGNLVNCVDINDQLYTGGKAWCKEDCSGFDTVTCEEVFHECGNSIVEGPEECDGGLVDCVEIDPYLYSGGKAACEDDCSGWDTITCDEREPVCGDSVTELGEVCDSETKKCVEIDPKYYLGDAPCNDKCDGWILDNCVEGEAVCGNDIVEGFEECDGSIDECLDIDPTKYSGGKAYCKDDCSGWDTITCTEKSGVIEWTDGNNYNAAFDPRASHCAVYFDNKFWIIGGSNAEKTFSDIWSSVDGVAWTKEVTEAAFGARQRHKCVVFDGKIWVIGGRDGSGTNKSSVWYSANGTSWDEDNVGSDGFSPGSNFEAIVKGGSIFVFGVAGSFLEPANGIWERNVIGWNKLSETVPYGTESSFAGAYINDTFILTGGIDASFQSVNSNIWYSENGKDWESSQGDFFPRAFHSVVKVDNAAYIIGGNTLMTRTNDVLKSTDGLNWGVITTDAGFEGRSSHAVATSMTKLCIIGGTFADGTYSSNVWCVDI
jgi:hypothetical protein